MKEFMLQFKEGQEYLISENKLRWVYQHGLSNYKYRKEVDRELTVRQLEIIRGNHDNGYYCFYYNSVLIRNFSIDIHSDPNLVILAINDPFPGYAPGHIASYNSPYKAKAIKNCGLELNREFHDALGMEERVATLKILPQPDQHETDNPQENYIAQPSCQSEELLCDPVCNSISRACEHKHGNPCPELSQILMKPGTMIVSHLVRPNTGHDCPGTEPQSQESSSAGNQRTPLQEGF